MDTSKPGEPKARWHDEDGVVGVWSASAWKLLYERPFTVTGIVIALVVLSRPQVNHVLLGAMWPSRWAQGVAMAVYGVGVALLFVATVSGMILVVPSESALSDLEIAALPRVRRPVARFTRWLALRSSFIVDRFTEIDRWLHAREGGGQRHGGRWAIGLGLVATAVVVWSWGALGDGACRWAAVTRRLLVTLAILLSAAWFLVRHDPEGPRRRRLGRYALMTLVGLVTGEVLWCLPDHLCGVFSFRFYTIWAILFLLFVVVATGRLVDRTALRVRVVLVAVVFVVMRFTSGFEVDTRAAIGSAAIAGAHADEGAEWFERLERRIDAGRPEGPVVFVAASGGGSRAAMFASLVYEHLNHTAFDGRPTKDPSAAIAGNVALMSGVSGGSLATAYYLAHPATERRDPLRNYTKDEIAAGIRRTAGAYVAGGCPVPDNDLTVSRYQRACKRLGHDVEGLPGRSPDAASWLFESAFVDDMATDFMAPLLRGVLTPFLERGHSVSDFWAEHFRWVRDTQRSCLTTGALADSWRCDWSQATPPPLALLNSTNVEDGSRVVIGYPPVPADLLGRGAKSLSDFGGAHDLGLADGVRLSANFPWGFEVGLFAKRPYTFVLPDSIKLTDGGVTDNSGIDTIATLLEALKKRSDPPNTDAVPAPHSADELYATHARKLRDTLVRRGVMLVEIDSGARPERSATLEALFPAVTDPLDALSLASFGGTTTIKAGNIARIRDALEGMAKQGAADAAPDVAHLFRHVPFVCNHADTIMTAWALGPEDKAAVMARFLLEAEANAELLREQAGGLARLEGGVAALERSERTKPDSKAQREMINAVLRDLREGIAEGAREETTSFGAPTAPDEPEAPGSTAAAPTQEGWIYLGQWDSGRWATSYVVSKGGGLAAPSALGKGALLTASGRVNVRAAMPDENASFGAIQAVLQPGSTVTLGRAPQRWLDTDFYWAEVGY
ncbi:MAG TPA: patatin-like phospholipase family protein [Polyangia bacterium]|nr:patatin-like phospholipase family protein [Polyangia bacterium]